MYMDQTAIKILCANTNKNAAKNIAVGKKFRWADVTVPEMYQYIGLTLYMSILKLPKIRDFWRTDSIFHVEYPRKVMSRKRFQTITGNLHMSYPAEDVINDGKKGTGDYDCLHRIRPIYDSLRVACKAVYQPRQELSVDERMVATKARIALKQYIKNKPTKWGIKLFVLSDTTGYTVDFNIYSGRSTMATGKGLSFDAVLSLINKSYLGSGYHIYCDNFYTSPALFLHLHHLGFGACGTYRDARIGIPKTKINAPRGAIRWIREGPLLFIKWMDTREVSVCSTLHTAFSGDTVKRICKAGRKYAAVEVPVPAAVKHYNRYMGGVDLSDQLIGSYSSWRKSRKWYLTVLHHFIDIAVTNSFLVHKELCGLEQQSLTHQGFLEQLSEELCSVPSQQVLGSQHIPVALVEGASGSKKATAGRRRCKQCGKCTPFMCEACKVPLCVIMDRNCHKLYHSSTGGTEQ
ncbi:piggyBac transposable element-derived protein 4-like [Acanthochromis polyacanthus]|uniref:piggyBac transposable element-derived protein 4-like n=1 Tax=Acanthochromis polyacanthus TaxID=80966 RepID=UPI002234A1E3|nr:piggyBac transposable element-derived protein 4-like [Acanthochromis polyacanthus]